MHDEATFGVHSSERVQARNKIVSIADAVERSLAHARHDAHAGDDVAAVSNFDAQATVGRILRAKNVGRDEHGAALHRAFQDGADFGFAFLGGHPVVGGTGIVLVASADEGDAFGAGHVVRIAAVQVRVRVGGRIQFGDDAVVEQAAEEMIIFGVGAVAPDNFRRLRGVGRFLNPSFKWRGH
jgi:hypothetical protein